MDELIYSIDWEIGESGVKQTTQQITNSVTLKVQTHLIYMTISLSWLDTDTSI
jgi:hypothetical protein